jgi:hypothetical protein
MGVGVQYQIRPMSLGEILDTGFAILRDHFVPIVGISALVDVPLTLIGRAIPKLAPGTTPSMSDAIGMVLPLYFMVLVLGPIGTVAITYLIGELYQGRSTTIGRAFRETFAILLPLVGTSVVGGVWTLLAFLALVIPGIWLMLGLWILSQVMIFERRFGTRGIQRSLDLMSGHRMRALGAVLPGLILVPVLTFAFQLGSRFVPHGAPIASELAGVIGTAFLRTVSVVLYFDLRCRKEAFEIEHLARLVRAGAAPPQPAR